ncbi:MAG: SUMF1/EgtB/PvdO family nonheme iron enzyme, partial [Anaerolineales bacterium]|nr:SUMF1/EgtB/PvdO family nonheme iron enzyme [Anaerolineales bacterium]
QLSAPEIDAQSLQEVLEDTKIGFFDDVTVLRNQDSQRVREAIEAFFSGRKRGDTLLLYFSGHGVLDPNGRLYLATTNTKTNSLRATGISAQFISESMDDSHSQRQILILDCCHSGAFARNSKAAVDRPVGTATAFEGDGTGRVILTATDSTQHAWEGDELLRGDGRSRFTYHLVEGLKTGKADRYGKGHITVDDLYEYVYEQVKDDSSGDKPQTPRKWSYNREGELMIAKNLHGYHVEEQPDHSTYVSPLSMEHTSSAKQLLSIPFGHGGSKWSLGVVAIVVLGVLVGIYSIFGTGDDKSVISEGEATETQPIEPSDFVPQNVYGIEWIRIPTGPFMMGAAEGDTDADDDESPLHEINLDTFWIAKTEVTNEQYKAFVDDIRYDPPSCVWEGNIIPDGLGDHPVVCVSWLDAVAYSEWLSEETGLEITLPSEAEWEKAARGDDDTRIYPWGDSFDGRLLNCDFRCSEDGFSATAPVGSFPEGASPYGVLDMSGNAWEWTRSIYDQDDYPYPYDSTDGREDMDNTSHFRVLRGGSWGGYSGSVRVSNRRMDLAPRSMLRGFRVIVLSRPPS